MNGCILAVCLMLVAGTVYAEETQPDGTIPAHTPVTAPQPPAATIPPKAVPVSPGATAMVTPDQLKKQADVVNLAIEKDEAKQAALEAQVEAQLEKDAEKAKKAGQDAPEDVLQTPKQ